MKDKLMELLLADAVCSTGDTGECDSCEYCYNEDACYKRMSSCIADNMLANNVVVLPVKPGDAVYTISRGKIKEWTVYYLGMNTRNQFSFNFHDKNLQNSRMACDEDLGETVFLTKEDAEKLLRKVN